ncbi:hypothetical protein BD626DRAFT_518786 [Schizophyllum amplum]|uniref:VWFA domain-containing protein n=1 Tax=Schizophyllum amplum TaxID=97359 RepID=A0A550BVS6_9AGAR|nr:hypothetical protein BD626DRAFT_518786 [Auriculariopsis ampla]
MPLEATMMVIDNSEFMRNGDYAPTRFDAQADAVNIVFQTKIDSNPENTVGVMSMAGKGPEVLVTHSKDLGQILQAIHKTRGNIGGAIDIPTAIAIAQLALKHRENKNLRQRIIVFVGSPLEGPAADEKGMIKLAKKLKKNNVAVDVVSFGDGIEEPNAEGKTVLGSFVDSVSSGDNSHLVTIPAGAHLLSDALISSPILSADRSAGIPEELGGTGGGGGGGGGGGDGGAGGGGDFEFGVDPTLDPELAMALRMSMQEEQARQAAEAARAPPAAQPPQAASSSTTVPAGATDNEEEAMLAQALAMSQDVDMESGGAKSSAPEASRTTGDVPMDDDEEDEEAAIARAIQLSMEGNDAQGKDKK